MSESRDVVSVGGVSGVGRRRHSVCLISDFFYPRLGGVEMHIWSLAQCLLELNHHVVIVTHAYGSRSGVRYMTNGLKVYYISMTPFYDQDCLPTVFSGMELFRQVLVRERITVVHGHAATSVMAHECFILARVMGYRAVYTDHSLYGFADATSINVNKVLKFTLSDVDHSICVSHTDRENLVLRASLEPRRTSAIPNAVDPSRFTPDPRFRGILPGEDTSRRRRRRKRAKEGPVEVGFRENSGKEEVGKKGGLGVDDDDGGDGDGDDGAVGEGGGLSLGGLGRDVLGSTSRVQTSPAEIAAADRVIVVMMSRLVYRKGVDLAVEVIPAVCRRFPQVHFLVGGDGPKMLELEEMTERHSLQDRVHLLGAVPHAAVRAVLVRGHIFLNCSLTESFCIAMLEAASCGLFVVSTDVGGVPEVLPEDMVEFGKPNVDSLTDALARAVPRAKHVNPWTFHRAVARMYSWRDVAKRTTAVYDRAAAEPIPPLVERLRRYFSAGALFGWICVAIVALAFLLWRAIETVRPANAIELAPVLPLNRSKKRNKRKKEEKEKRKAGEGADPEMHA